MKVTTFAKLMIFGAWLITCALGILIAYGMFKAFIY